MGLVKVCSFILPICLAIFHGVQSQCDVPSVTTVSGTHAPSGQICSGQLIFNDEFESLDMHKWQHEITLAGGGNWEFQWYTNSRYNSWVEDGKLKIKPTLVADDEGEQFMYSGLLDINGGAPADSCTDAQFYGCIRSGSPDTIINPVKSARLRTVYSFAFKYGKVEVSAKMPAGDWLWPAIWLLPRYNQYAGWPASGEIDLMECRGNRDLVDASGKNLGTKLVTQTLHWGPSATYNQYQRTQFETTYDPGYDGDFHRYQLEWGPDGLTFGIDDVMEPTISPPEGGFWELGDLDSSGLANPWRFDSKMAPFDQEFYLLINLAVGGTNGFFPDGITNPGGKPWSNTSPRAAAEFWEGNNQWLPTWQRDTDNPALQVDYVKVWAY